VNLFFKYQGVRISSADWSLSSKLHGLSAEGTGAHGPEQGERGLGPGELGLPLGELLASTAGSFPAKRRGTPAGGCGHAKFFQPRVIWRL